MLSRSSFIHLFLARNTRSGWFFSILSHINCFIQADFIGLQVLLGSLHPRSMRVSSGLLQFSKEEAVKSFLACVSPGIQAVWWNWEKHHDLVTVERCGCLVVRLRPEVTKMNLRTKSQNWRAAKCKGFTVLRISEKYTHKRHNTWVRRQTTMSLHSLTCISQVGKFLRKNNHYHHHLINKKPSCR